MKSFLFAIIAALLAYPSHAEDVSNKTVDKLLTAIRAELPKGWSVSYKQDDAWLEIIRNKKVLSLPALPNSNPSEKPKKTSFIFAFRIVPLVSPAKHKLISAENAAITALYEDLVRRNIPRKYDSFSPQNEEDKKLVSQYEALKRPVRSLPDFYFQDISLKWAFNSPNNPIVRVADDRIREECNEVQQKVVRLLTKYEST